MFNDTQLQNLVSNVEKLVKEKNWDFSTFASKLEIEVKTAQWVWKQMSQGVTPPDIFLRRAVNVLDVPLGQLIAGPAGKMPLFTEGTLPFQAEQVTFFADLSLSPAKFEKIHRSLLTNLQFNRTQTENFMLHAKLALTAHQWSMADLAKEMDANPATLEWMWANAEKEGTLLEPHANAIAKALGIKLDAGQKNAATFLEKNISEAFELSFLSQRVEKGWSVPQFLQRVPVERRAILEQELAYISQQQKIHSKTVVTEIAAAFGCRPETFLKFTKNEVLVRHSAAFIDAAWKGGFSLQQLAVETEIAEQKLIEVICEHRGKLAKTEVKALAAKGLPPSMISPFAGNRGLAYLRQLQGGTTVPFRQFVENFFAGEENLPKPSSKVSPASAENSAGRQFMQTLRQKLAEKNWTPARLLQRFGEGPVLGEIFLKAIIDGELPVSKMLVAKTAIALDCPMEALLPSQLASSADKFLLNYKPGSDVFYQQFALRELARARKISLDKLAQEAKLPAAYLLESGYGIGAKGTRKIAPLTQQELTNVLKVLDFPHLTAKDLVRIGKDYESVLHNYFQKTYTGGISHGNLAASTLLPTINYLPAREAHNFINNLEDTLCERAMSLKQLSASMGENKKNLAAKIYAAKSGKEVITEKLVVKVATVLDIPKESLLAELTYDSTLPKIGGHPLEKIAEKTKISLSRLKAVFIEKTTVLTTEEIKALLNLRISPNKFNHYISPNVSPYLAQQPELVYCARNAVNQLRKEKQISFKTLAKKTGINEQFLARMLGGNDFLADNPFILGKEELECEMPKLLRALDSEHLSLTELIEKGKQSEFAKNYFLQPAHSWRLHQMPLTHQEIKYFENNFFKMVRQQVLTKEKLGIKMQIEANYFFNCLSQLQKGDEKVTRGFVEKAAQWLNITPEQLLAPPPASSMPTSARSTPVSTDVRASIPQAQPQPETQQKKLKLTSVETQYFRDNLQTLLEKRQLSKGKLAGKVGNVAYVLDSLKKINLGEKIPARQFVEKIAAVLEVSPEVLLTPRPTATTEKMHHPPLGATKINQKTIPKISRQTQISVERLTNIFIHKTSWPTEAEIAALKEAGIAPKQFYCPAAKNTGTSFSLHKTKEDWLYLRRGVKRLLRSVDVSAEEFSQRSGFTRAYVRNHVFGEMPGKTLMTAPPPTPPEWQKVLSALPEKYSEAEIKKIGELKQISKADLIGLSHQRPGYTIEAFILRERFGLTLEQANKLKDYEAGLRQWAQTTVFPGKQLEKLTEQELTDVLTQAALKLPPSATVIHPHSAAPLSKEKLAEKIKMLIKTYSVRQVLGGLGIIIGSMANTVAHSSPVMFADLISDPVKMWLDQQAHLAATRHEYTEALWTTDLNFAWKGLILPLKIVGGLVDEVFHKNTHISWLTHFAQLPANMLEGALYAHGYPKEIVTDILKWYALHQDQFEHTLKILAREHVYNEAIKALKINEQQEYQARCIYYLFEKQYGKVSTTFSPPAWSIPAEHMTLSREEKAIGLTVPIKAALLAEFPMLGAYAAPPQDIVDTFNAYLLAQLHQQPAFDLAAELINLKEGLTKLSHFAAVVQETEEQQTKENKIFSPAQKEFINTYIWSNLFFAVSPALSGPMWYKLGQQLTTTMSKAMENMWDKEEIENWVTAIKPAGVAELHAEDFRAQNNATTVTPDEKNIGSTPTIKEALQQTFPDLKINNPLDPYNTQPPDSFLNLLLRNHLEEPSTRQAEAPPTSTTYTFGENFSANFDARRAAQATNLGNDGDSNSSIKFEDVFRAYSAPTTNSNNPASFFSRSDRHHSAAFSANATSAMPTARENFSATAADGRAAQTPSVVNTSDSSSSSISFDDACRAYYSAANNSSSASFFSSSSSSHHDSGSFAMQSAVSSAQTSFSTAACSAWGCSSTLYNYNDSGVGSHHYFSGNRDNYYASYGFWSFTMSDAPTYFSSNDRYSGPDNSNGYDYKSESNSSGGGCNVS